MTPQEKAKELVQKYYTWGIRKDGQTLSYLEAKQCAAIAVDEILAGDHLIRTPLSFWQKVKQEIEKPNSEQKDERSVATGAK